MEIGASIGSEWGIIGVIALLFGILYAITIHQLKQSDRLEGYTAFAVVIGVAITVGLSGFIIGWGAVLGVFFIFVCTGTPMVIGDIYQHTTERNQKAAELRRILSEGRDGN